MNENLKYPTKRVLFGFACGGIFGGLTFSIMSIYDLFLSSDLFYALKELFRCILAGLLWGFIPLLLVGFYCHLKQVVIKTWRDYLYLFFMGFSMLLLFFWILCVFEDSISNGLLYLKILFSVSLHGGISAVICGKLYLPKLKHYSQNDLGEKP